MKHDHASTAKVLPAPVRAWHRPHNSLCPHNADPAIACTCARECRRKPFRVVRVEDHSAPVGTRRHHPKLVLSIWPNGVIKIREHGRRREYALTASSLFVRARWAEAMQIFREQSGKRSKAKGGKKAHGKRRRQ